MPTLASLKKCYHLDYLLPLCGLGLIWWYFDPVFQAGPHAIPSSFLDGWIFVWDAWWLSRSLFGGGIYHTQELFHPAGTSLYLHTLCEGLLVPLVLALKDVNFPRVLQCACLIAFELNFLSAFALFRHYSGKACLAFFLSIVFAFHPYFLAHLNGGHLNLLCFFPVVICVFAFLKCLDANQVRYLPQIVAGLSIGYCTYLCLYYVYFACLALGLLTLGALVSRKVKIFCALKRVWLVGLIALLVSLPKLYGVYSSMASGEFTSNHAAERHSADLISFLAPGESSLLFGMLDLSNWHAGVRVNVAESGVYICLSLLVLLCIALRKDWRGRVGGSPRWVLLVGSLLSLLLACGPEFQFRGTELLANPIYLIASRLPYFPSVPARFGVMSIFFLCCYFAYSFKDGGLPGKLARTVVVLVALLELFPVPISVVSRPPTAALMQLAQHVGITAVHDTSRLPDRVMSHQIYHGKAVTRGFISRRPLQRIRSYRGNAFVRYLRGGRGISSAEAIEGLEQLAVQGVIVERGQSEVQQRVEELGSFELLRRDAEVVVYVLG